MKITKTTLDGVFILEQSVFEDCRGAFVKTFQKSFFEQHGLEWDFTESYYTQSKQGVVRGMHFQTPPYDHAKLVTIIHGHILDVILDLRKDSRTYGKCEAFELSRENHRSIYIPRGCAHGFTVLSESAITYYMVSSEYNAEHDSGILWNSFGFDWPVENPITSGRDQTFVRLADFISPF